MSLDVKLILQYLINYNQSSERPVRNEGLKL